MRVRWGRRTTLDYPVRDSECFAPCLLEDARREDTAYGECLKAGRSIATGVLEGTYRSLVLHRMESGGARWSLSGAEAILRLRALVQGGDFDAYWKFHEACEQERNHSSQYAGGKIPTTRSTGFTPERPDLKLVK